MLYRRVFFDFQTGGGFEEVTNLVKFDDFTYSIMAGSDTFHYAQSVANLSLVYDATIYTKVIGATADIIVKIIDTDETDSTPTIYTPLFYGHIAPSKTHSYDGILENIIITLEVLDDGDYLDKEIGDICYRHYTIMNPASPSTSIVHQLAYLAGFTEGQIDSSITIPIELNAFVPPSTSDTIKDLLDALLFEYGYILHFNASGQISPILWEHTNDTGASTFNENNIIDDSFDITDGLKEYDGAEITYYELGEGITTSGQTDILLYRDGDLPYASDGSFLGYAVLSGYTYPPLTNVIDETTGAPTIVYQKYEDTAIKYWTNKAITEKLDYNYKAFTSDFSSIVATSGWYLDYRADAGVKLITAKFENTQARIVFSGINNDANLLYYCNVYGKILYKTSERVCSVVTVSGSDNIDNYISTFVFEKEYADLLCKFLALQHSTNNLNIDLESEQFVEVGELVYVVTGDNTNELCYVAERKYTEKTKLYAYSLRSYMYGDGITLPALTSQSVTSPSRINGVTSSSTAASPPSNNVTSLDLSYSPNADGTVKVTATWSYVQGGNKADGAYIYCKAALTDPSPIDFSADPAEYRPMSADGTYTWEKILPVRTGGSAGAPIIYRFGVVAAKGVMLHSGGVVEVTTPVDWTKIGFTSAIQFDANNYWDLVTGAFKVSDSTGDEFSLVPGSGITLKARLLQLQADLSRLYSTIEFYRNRSDYETPSYGKQRVAIGEGALYFDKYTTAWNRNGGFHALASDVAITGKFVSKLGSSIYGQKTRAQIASANAYYPGGCAIDSSHVIGAWTNYDLGKYAVRLGTISGDTISWGAEQYGGFFTCINPCVEFVSATRFIVVGCPESAPTTLVYTWGTYSAGVITIGTANAKSLAVSDMYGNAKLSKTKTLGTFVAYYSNYNGDKIGKLCKFTWNDSTQVFTQGTPISITSFETERFGDIILIGDYLLVTYKKLGETRLRFDLYNESTLAIVASDFLIDSGLPNLSKVPGLASDRMALLYSGTQHYLMQIDDPQILSPITVTNAPNYVIPDGTASLGVALENLYYYTPFDTTEYMMAQLGAGIIESGSNANGSYIKFSDGTMECWRHMALGADAAVPFPVAFTSTPTVILSLATEQGDAQMNISYLYTVFANQLSASYMAVRGRYIAPGAATLFPFSSSTQGYLYINWTAIGRWKA